MSIKRPRPTIPPLSHQSRYASDPLTLLIIDALTVNSIRVAFQRVLVSEPIVEDLVFLVGILSATSDQRSNSAALCKTHMLQTVPLTSTLSVDMQFIIKTTVV